MNSLSFIRIAETLRTWISICVPVVILLSVSSSTVFSQLTVEATPPPLTISTALPGSEPTAVQDASTRLRIRRQAVVAKVTVATNCVGQKFTLKALAVSNEAGNPAPEVTLVHNAPAADFLVNLPTTGPGNVRTNVRFTASATYAQGTGIDSHTVTYTHVAQ